jgi:hypothetical protein
VTVEGIYLAGMIYMKIEGKWTSGGTMKDLEQLTQKKHENSKAMCRYIKDELVNGEMTALYSLSDVSDNSKIESQVWISKAKGLPVRQDVDIELGAGKGKMHNSTRFEYGNIKAPI